MTAIEPRTARHEIASREYEDLASVKGALVDRQVMTSAVETAKRARADAREWLWNAREAERTLGRMILTARQAGDLAERGTRNDFVVDGDKVPTLADLGINRDLAAYAVQLAQVPDDTWESWRSEHREPSQALIARSVEDYRRAHDEARRVAAEIQDQKKRLKTERSRIEQALKDLAAELADEPAPATVPLAAEEPELTGVIVPAPPRPQLFQDDVPVEIPDDGLGELAAEVAELQAREQQARRELTERRESARRQAQEAKEAADRKQRDARVANTRFAEAMTTLYGLGAPEAMSRCAERWDPANCDSPPYDVTPGNMRDAAATLELIAKLFEERET